MGAIAAIARATGQHQDQDGGGQAAITGSDHTQRGRQAG
jgi:hypothetical protein